MFPKIYDLNLKPVAILENAFAVGYEKRLNELWTAQFSLPANDPKNAECQPFRFVEIFDGDERVDLFRIVPMDTKRQSDGYVVTYHCEHVLATLLDDILFQYHQVGNLGVYTEEVLNYILDKQTVQRWKLGTVDFAHQFEYKWENENLLAAAFSVPKLFLESYMWTWDTTSYPWTLNLVQAGNEVKSKIRYSKNLRGVRKTEDPTTLCTRLYALGYGEGVNQLNIKNVNPTGLPYIDVDTQAQYGVISRVWVDRRYENESTLFNAAKAMLEELKVPYLSYSVDAADLYQITKDSVDKFELGSLVRVKDDELGIDINARVVSLSKGDVYGNPGDIQIEIANKSRDIASSIAELADRTRINEVYAQGATNLDSHDFADNCDPDNPAVIRFYLPAETVRINKMLLSYETGQFRAYSKGAASGGGDTSGPSSETTSGSGGGLSLSFNERGSVDFGVVLDTFKNFIKAEGGDGTPLDHYHNLYDFRIALPSHTHGMDHTHELPDHTHPIEYGIYLGPSPSSVTVRVDGNIVPGLGTSATDVDIIPYLSKDTDGKINRGTWHEITITPNSLGRVVANVVTQLFVQSRGGGDY